MTELLLTHELTVEARFLAIRVANRKKRAERFSERARKGWATRRARG